MATKPFNFRQAKLSPKDPQPGERLPVGYTVVTFALTAGDGRIQNITVLLDPQQSSMRWDGQTIKTLTRQIGTVTAVTVPTVPYDSKLR